MNAWQNLGLLKKNGHKNTHPLNPKVLELICNIFAIYIYFVMCTECQILTEAQKYRCQLYIILATCSQNLGRLNRRLLEVL